MTASNNNHFIDLGPSLIANGYTIVPIKPGEKRPALAGWQNSNLGLSDLRNYPGCGAGVICGRGEHPIVAIDIDISHPGICNGVLAWCREHMGHTAERIGAAPRILLVYRAQDGGWTKGHSARFFDPADPEKINGKPNEQQVEVLSMGQQFVAYHVHPDTGQEYQWTDAFGGIAHMHAAWLPVISEQHVDALLTEVDRLVRQAMLTQPDIRLLSTGSTPTLALSAPWSTDGAGGGLAGNALLALSPRCDVPLSESSDLLSYVDNDGIGQDYSFWLGVGMALHHEYSGTPDEAAALALWKSWGNASNKNDPKQYDYKWESFGKLRGQPTTLRWLLKIAHQAKQDAELAQRRTVLDEMKAQVLACEDPFELTGGVAKKLRGLMPEDPIVLAEMVACLRSRYKVLSGSDVMLPLKAVRDLLTPERKSRAPTVLEAQPLTEFGNAKRMVDRYKGEMIYVPEVDQWHLWDGHHWRKASKIEVEYRAKQTVLGLVDEAKIIDTSQLPEFFEFCKHSQAARMVHNMISLAASEPEIMVPIGQLDRKSHLLGTRNGVVDLASGLFREGRKDDFITLSTACEFQPGAKCPLFDQTLLDVFNGDGEMAEFFMRCLGYALMGNPKEAMLFIPFGNGSNGKSTLLNVVRQVFGSYAKTADAGSFVADSGVKAAGGAREDLLRLKGARFVYVNEPDEGGELREGIVKSMTGGDAITARGLFAKASVEFVPTWATFMPTNHKPIIKGTDNGIWRRLTLIPFERNFENDPTIAKDPDRPAKLLAEMPGVLNRLIEAAMRYQRVGLQLTSRVRAAREQYREQMDVLSDWIGECCEVGPGHTEQMARLWESWQGFANRNGMQNFVRSSISLGRKLDQKYPAGRTPKGLRCRVGIRVKDTWDFKTQSVEEFNEVTNEPSVTKSLEEKSEKTLDLFLVSSSQLF